MRRVASRLAAGLALLASLGLPSAQAAPARRVVSLDWAATAMLLSLGIRPVGAGDPDLYRVWVGEPALPGDVPDLGLRTEPSLETLAALKPDLILISPLGATTRPILQRIAPTQMVELFGDGSPLDAAAAALRTIAAATGREAEADAEIRDFATSLSALRGAVEGRRTAPLLVIQFLDARHVRIYAEGSLFGDVVTRLGLPSAWTQPTNGWGFTLVGVETLARFPEATIVVVDPLPPGVTLAAGSDDLWGALPAVRAGRVLRLATSWPFGDLTAGLRFAKLLVAALAAAPPTDQARLDQAPGDHAAR